MQELEHLSLKVDHQISRHTSILAEKKEEMEFQIQEAQKLHHQLEDLLKQLQPAKEKALAEKNSSDAKTEKTHPSQKDKDKLPEFHFGHSPFIDSSYEEGPST